MSFVCLLYFASNRGDLCGEGIVSGVIVGEHSVSRVYVC